MTDALKNAAEEASAATGLLVEVQPTIGREDSPDITDPVTIEVWTPIDSEDGDQPIIIYGCPSGMRALAYLEGLTQGAHISNVRHAKAIDHFRMLLNLYNPARGSVGRDILYQAREALAELGTTTQAREES